MPSKNKDNISGKVISEEEFMKALNALYGKALDGIPKVSRPLEDTVNDYLKKHHNKKEAAKSFINWQIAKCTTSGFLTSLGGLITLPVAIPANISSVLYVQLRMVAGIALMGGYDIKSDQVQTFVYVCLTGQGAKDILKNFGIKFGEKLAVSQIKKIPGAVLVKINQAVGFRFITKFGEKGLINLGKMVPLVGGVIGGAFDLGSTKVIADSAEKLFLTGKQTANVDIYDDNIIDIG